MAIVLHHSKAKGTALNVLLGVANHDGDGGAWPSVETLAKYGRCQRRRVQQILGELVDEGELSVEHQAGGLPETADYRRPNRYRVLVSCPVDCDGTAQHRTSARRRIIRTGDAVECTGGVQPTAPGGGATGCTLTTPKELPIEPSQGIELNCLDTARFAHDVEGAPEDSQPDDDADTFGDQSGDKTAARFSDWRAEDRELFNDVIGERLTSDGTAWTEGTFATYAFYQAFRSPKNAKPIQWPGRFFQHLEDSGAIEDWLAFRGLERAT